VSECLRRARRGVQGGGAPREGVQGQRPRIFFFGPTYFRRVDIFLGRHISGMTYYRDDIFQGPHDIRWFFGTWFLPMVFYFRLRN
jgi:hypothetical protein